MEQVVEKFVDAPVVAAFVLRPDGKAFFVKKGKRWTLLTGKFDWGKERELRHTVFREVGEEAFSLEEDRLGLDKLMEEAKERIDIIGLIDTLPFDMQEEAEGGGKRVVMSAYLCEVSEEGAKNMRYEGGQDFYWAFPSQELANGNMVDETGMALDRVGRRFMELYLERYSELKTKKRKVVRMAEWFREGFKIIFEKSPE